MDINPLFKFKKLNFCLLYLLFYNFIENNKNEYDKRNTFINDYVQKK